MGTRNSGDANAAFGMAFLVYILLYGLLSVRTAVWGIGPFWVWPYIWDKYISNRRHDGLGKFFLFAGMVLIWSAISMFF